MENYSGLHGFCAMWYNDKMENVTSPKVLKDLMQKYGIAPLKRFGQNFLIDGNIADNIASSAVPKEACALEIGPGFGALTGRLLSRAERVAAYEIDAGLFAALSDMYADNKRLFLFHRDFLKAELEAELASLFSGKPIYVAANLPYYITSPCIMKLLTSRLPIEMITVMVQKEVADRICAPAGSKDYGALSAAIGYFAKPSLLMRVSATCFYPRPDVASSVIQLQAKPHNETDARAYLHTVRALFGMRRKTVKSNLRQAFGLGMQIAEEVLRAAGIDENARAEMLAVEDFMRVSAALKNYVDLAENVSEIE